MTGNNSTSWKLIGWVALAVLNCAIIVPVLDGLWPAPHDFGDCYTGAYIYLHHPKHLLYDIHLQRETEKQLFNIPDGQLDKRFLPWNHLPYELVLYLPLVALPYSRAFLVWNIESLALLALSALLLAKSIPTKYDWKAILFIALGFFPVVDCFLSGQDTMVTLALFSVCLWLLKNERHALAGAVLGLCLFKLQLVLPIIGIFVLRRAWQVLAGFASSGIVLAIISTLMVGYEGMRGFVRILLTGESGDIACINPVTMPNIRGFLAVVTKLQPHLIFVATLALSVLLLFVAVRQAATFSAPQHFLAMCMCFVALVSFHTNVYDLSILLLPILLLLEIDGRSKITLWVGMPPVILLFCSPIINLRAVRPGLLAAVVGWLWYATAYAVKHQEVSTVTAAEIACSDLPSDSLRPVRKSGTVRLRPSADRVV